MKLTVEPRRRERLEALLREDEILRAERFFRETDRCRFIVGRGFLRRILASYLDTRASLVELRYSPQGKPALAAPGEPALEFNFTHSAGLAVCALTKGRRIGVDIEKIRVLRDMDGLVDRFFSGREADSYRALSREEHQLAFFRAWTRKEACLKATGEGLTFPLGAVEVTLGPDDPPRALTIRGSAEEAARWSLRSFQPESDTIGSVAVEGEISTLHRWTADSLGEES